MNTKSVLVAALLSALTIDAFSQETVTDTGNRIVKGNLTVEGTTTLSNLYLPSSEKKDGLSYTYLKYPGHVLAVSSPTGWHIHNMFYLMPGGSDQGSLYSVFAMYNALSQTSHERKVQIHTSGISYLNGGNVGIGTTNPQYPLDVNGTIRSTTQLVEGDLTVKGTTTLSNLYLPSSEKKDGLAYTYLKYPGHILNVGSPEGIYSHNHFNLKPGGSSQGSLYTVFGMYNALSETSSEKKVQIHSSGISYFNGGNVGIGTTNPQNKLDVQGTIRATEVKVETGWADFVFADDYKLPTLKEVEAYISEHRHLPGIPSEAEVKAEGVSLGDMQAKLLQKIEELTLYVIEQDKKLSEQAQQMNKQNEEIQQLRNDLSFVK